MTRIILPALLLVLSAASNAQDANYWSSTYGPGGFFSPGSTIAKNGDSGVLFYNPALLAYNTKNASNISGSIYNFQTTNFNDGAGLGLNLKATSTYILPVLASNTIYLKLKKPITVAYAIMSTPVMKFHASQRRDAMINILPDGKSPGNEFFVGQYVHANTVEETSGILAVGKPITNKLALGLTFGFTNRRQEFHHNMSINVLSNDLSTTYDQRMVSIGEYYLVHSNVWNLGIKAGLSYELNPKNHLGLLVTLPSIHLTSRADLIVQYNISNLVVGTEEIFMVASSKQTKLSSKWRTPLSIAGGYTLNYGKGDLYFSAEYFVPLSEYNVITPRDEYFVRPQTGIGEYFTSSMMQLKNIHKSILNYAVGASFPLKEKVTGYLSLRTDFNYSDQRSFSNDDGYRSNTATWDIYHMQLGTNFKKRKFNLRAGLLLSYGRKSQLEQMVSFDNPTQENALEGALKKISATRMAAGLMLAYIHNF
jgi:hypothetical protein